jgi:hydroxyethylthiazole kinase-like uncharacterized protein yjeF
MGELLTAAQMRGIEAAAIASGRVTGLGLMARAVAGVTEAILRRWPDLRAGEGRAVVLCGPGNNGGDGYGVARALADWGLGVQVFALAEPATAEARAMRARWGGPVAALGALDWPDLAARPLVIDAMFGTGLVRDIAPGVWGALAMAQEAGCRLVAVDILSGLCADSGRIRSASGHIERPADLTVTFERARCGHHLADAARLGGALEIVGLGLEPEVDALLRRDAAEVAELARPRDPGKHGGHKYDHGHALVLAGGPGRGGAGRLAARAALRVGAGLVTLACPPEALAENAARLDAVMLRPVRDAGALAALLADARISALCLGPGLGLDAAAAALLSTALGAAPDGPARPTLLDADALTLLAADPGLQARLDGRCLLTPHAGEFARLCPDLAARLAAEAAPGAAAFSKLDAARQAAARWGAVVLVKGPDTVIAAPDGRAVISPAQGARAAPWLATAGSGDVLAGLAAGLMARGFPAFEAAETAAWLHLEAARAFGPGLIAEDLPEALPQVFRAMGVQ